MKKQKIGELFKRNLQYYDILKQTITEIHQKQNATVHYIGICKRRYSWTNEEVLIFVSQLPKITMIGLIDKCESNIVIPLTLLPSPNPKTYLQFKCIHKIYRSSKLEITIVFRAKIQEMWKLQFQFQFTSDRWLQLFIMKLGKNRQQIKEDTIVYYQNFNELSNYKNTIIPLAIDHIQQKDIDLLGTQTEQADYQKNSKQQEFSEIAKPIMGKNKHFDEETKLLEINQDLKSKIEMLQQTKINLQEYIKKQQQKLSLILNQNNYLKIQVQTQQHTINKINEQNNLLRQEMDDSIQKMQAQLTQKDAQIQKMLMNYVKLQKQWSLSLKQLERYKQSNKQLQNDFVKHQRQSDTNMEQISVKLKAQSDKCSKLESISNERRKQVLAFKKTIKDNIRPMFLEMAQLVQETKSIIKQSHLQFHNFFEVCSTQMKDYIEYLQLQQNRKIFRMQELEADRYLHIFQRSALSDQNDAKAFLIAQIQQLTSSVIRHTKLIYAKDSLNTVNFHKYIDNIPCMCLVVRTIHNHLLAGFSIRPLSSQQTAFEGGILVSMTNHLAYSCRPTKRAVSFDDYFLIFGNSQLRIKNGENILFSNFGIANGFYDNKGDRVQKLIGENHERQVQMVTYQIYQVIFK